MVLPPEKMNVFRCLVDKSYNNQAYAKWHMRLTDRTSDDELNSHSGQDTLRQEMKHRQ